jgi:hypothetical protein
MGNSGECARETERYQRIREALRSLPQRTPPPDLTLRLRMAASKVRVENTSGAGPWRRVIDRFQLGLTNLMRPLALPLAGGLCSAIFLFSALVPTFTATYAANRIPSLGDVPTALNTEPMVKCMAPVAFGEADAVVDLKIDEMGRVINYAIISGASGPQSDELRRRIENNLLFAEFWPATAFGRPISGTIRVSFRSTHLDVRG